MSDLSHVSIEQRVCLICGRTFDTGALLLDRRLRASMERHTTTGWVLCPDHKARADDGYIALIECDPARSGVRPDTGRVKPGDAYRTGRLAFVKRTVFARISNVAIPDDQPCVFVEPGIIQHLRAMSGTAK